MEVERSASKRKSKRASMVKTSRSSKNAASKRRSRDQEYEVESILSHAFVDGEVLYKVTWVGYPGEVTELTESDLKNCGELVQAYKERIGCGNLDSLSAVSINVGGGSGRNGNLSSGRNSPRKMSIEGINGSAGNFIISNDASSTLSYEAETTSKKDVGSSAKKATGDAQTFPAKRVRKAKQRVIAPDAELGYNNGCIVDEYKGFSTKYTEPVVLVSYKEPLPKGFEDRQDEIVPVRTIAEREPKKLIAHLVDLLSNGRGNVIL